MNLTAAKKRGQKGFLPGPDTLLFDMDGVLADVHGSYRAAIVATAAEFGVHVSDADIARAKNEGNANNDWRVTQMLLAAASVDMSLEAVTSVFQTLYLGHDGKGGLRERESLLIDKSMLDRLGRRYALGIVTGRPRKEASWFLDRFGIGERFGTVVAMEDAPLKPSPEGTLMALEALGASISWLLGDTPDDMRAASNAGALPVGIANPSEPESARALADAGALAVLDNVNDIIDLLP